jgi:hypothetical protein
MRRRGWLALPALLWLSAPSTALPASDIVGVDQHEGPVAAVLEVREEAGHYTVRLEGGGSAAQGPAAAADCVIEAQGDLDGSVLRARFGPVETDTFSYGVAQAESEGRTVQIAFEPGAAEVLAADTFGYCGLAAEFSGRYRADD